MTQPETPTPPQPRKKMTLRYLLARALLWALVTGVGIFLVLFLLAAGVGKTDQAYIAAYYMGPITFFVMFLGVLFLQVPKAMALKKGKFSVYLMLLTLPVLGLGGIILWYMFNG